MDIGREIRKAVETGKVVFGTDKTIQAVKTGDAKLVIVASNCPPETREALDYYVDLSGIHTHFYEGTGVELGTACGKLFIISVIAVISPGESNLLLVEGH